MSAKKVVASWVEMSQSYLSDAPPRVPYHEGHLFLNRCEVRQTKAGLILIRQLGLHEIRAESKAELERLVAVFALRADVRLLIKDLETNDFDALPRQTKKVTPELLNGTADIYETKEIDDEEISKNALCVA